MIVADASLLISLLIDVGPIGIRVRSLFVRTREVSVPDLAYVETAAVLRKKWLRKEIDPENYQSAVRNLLSLPLSSFPTHPLIARTVELRENLTAYDACYVALAERLQCDLITGDRRLTRATGPRCRIRLIQEVI